MKKYKILLSLILFLQFANILVGQTPTNAIKFNALSPIMDKYELSYERWINDNISLELDLGIIHHDEMLFDYTVGVAPSKESFNVFCLFCSNQEFVRVNAGKRGFSAEVGPKFYWKTFTEKTSGGFYFKPELTWLQYSFSQYRIVHEEQPTNSPVETTTFEELAMTNIGVKANLGVQLIIARYVTLDLFYFVGTQSRSIKTDETIRYSGEDAMYQTLGKSDGFIGFDFKKAVYGPFMTGVSVKFGFVF